MSEPVLFTLGNVKFRALPLGPRESLKGLDLIVQNLMPILVEGMALVKQGFNVEEEQAFFAKAGRIAANLPELYEILASRVEWENASGVWMSLANKSDYCFARNPALLIAFMSRAIREEYGSFFDVDGRSLLTGVGSDWTSLVTSIGGSGES